MTNNQEKKNIDQIRKANYDGIQEYDNDLPRWWVWLFYLTGVYGVIYVIGFYGFDTMIPPVPHELSEGVAANKTAPKTVAPNVVAQPSVDEAALLKAVLNSPEKIAKGKEVFLARCAACHKTDGGGLVGPNLTDDSWIHGGSLKEIKAVIENGVLEKGMLAWKSMLSQDDIRAVTAYVRTLKGSTPANAKAAEGTPYTGEE